MSTVKEMHGDKVAKEEVFILELAHPSQKSKALSLRLASELEHGSVVINKISWGASLLPLKGKRCISLLEVEESVLKSIDGSDFAALKFLVLQTSSLLWISCAGDPTASLAVGMARSIRNEIPNMRLRTLQIQSTSLDTPEMLAPIIARLARTVTEDHEFVEENRILKVPRVVEDSRMNKQMLAHSSASKDYVQTVLLKHMNAPQKLAIQNQGMLDTLCYEADDIPVHELPDDEVEIQVKSSGLK